jgi:hypothetical protein
MIFKLADDWQDTELVMTQTLIPNRRTREKGAKWRAVCDVDGRQYEAESRSSAPYCSRPHCSSPPASPIGRSA